MLVYVATLLVSSALALFSDLFAKRQASIVGAHNSISISGKHNSFSIMKYLSLSCYIGSALVLIAVRGFRYDVGYDYAFSYVPSFQTVLNGGMSHYDYLFNAYLWVISRFTDDYRVFFFVDSIIFITIVWIAIKLFRKPVFFPVLLFVAGYDYIRSFCFIAQYLAMAVCLLSLALLLRNKVSASIVLLVIAGLIHMSAFVFLSVVLIYLVAGRVKRSTTLFAVAAIGILLAIPAKAVLPLLYKGTRFSWYNATMYDDGSFQNRLVLINAAVLVVMISVSFLTREQLQRKFVIVVGIQTVALIFCVMQGAAPLLYRIVWYFMFPQIATVPIAIDRLKNTDDGSMRKFSAIIAFFIVLAYCAVTFGVYLPQNTDAVLPYQTIFSKTPLL